MRDRESCIHGHEWTPENTYVNAKTGYRSCRACRRSWITAHRERARAQRQVQPRVAPVRQPVKQKPMKRPQQRQPYAQLPMLARSEPAASRLYSSPEWREYVAAMREWRDVWQWADVSGAVERVRALGDRIHAATERVHVKASLELANEWMNRNRS